LVKLIAISCLDDVVYVTNKLHWEDTNEITCVANGLYLIECREWTDHVVGRFEVLPLNKGAYGFIVPLMNGQHLLDAKTRQTLMEKLFGKNRANIGLAIIGERFVCLLLKKFLSIFS